MNPHSFRKVCRCQDSFPFQPSVFFLTSLFRDVLYFHPLHFLPLAACECVSVCMCASAVMCSPVRPVKLPKNPSGERRPRSCRWLDRRDVPVWTGPPPPLCLSFFSVAPSPFSLVLVFSSFHTPPPATSSPPLSSAGRALLLLGADVVLLPVRPAERLVGGASSRLRQGDARPGVVRDVAAVGAEIQQCPAFVQETTASQVQLMCFKVGSFPKIFFTIVTQSSLR